ncbi:hypothetical protein F4678DRAFT_481781 [Xylaria arbuscula]|nr:hypothetical protein F4678DRAFT_481781 [Xylaria arbuscula]
MLGSHIKNVCALVAVTSIFASTPCSALFSYDGRSDVTGNASVGVAKAVHPPTQQNPAVGPPVPIFNISSHYINNAILTRLDTRALERRDALLCGHDTPCADGSCCGNDGICGYGPTYCGSGNCTSNCDATAMCGRYSDGGDIKCGMNLCCSYYGWCGTTETYCGNPDPNGQSPCQADYGLCEVVPPPSCGQGSGSTSGRTIGYYQADNVANRLCNKVTPSQLNTTGFTHLNYAFVQFDPSSYEITIGDSLDIVAEFTALKSRGLQTWVAVGGFDFSDATAPTHTAWSDMASTSAGRAAFISSLKSFMAQHGFQGADIDWEYPATPERGGKRADTENLVTLVKEMRTSFGSEYGISMTLAPDYWYLRYFDAKAMESSVDFFGFMAYDLHGSWDADVKTLGSLVRAQTDVREIANDTMPLWFDDLNPSKINFGTAYYGRGYTLNNAGCSDLLCPFSGPSNPGPCTNTAGVLSLREIQQKIDAQGLVPKLVEGAMIKQLVWEDQWIGYDDAETIAMKKSWADGYCFGGTLVWSIDFNSAGSGDDPPATTDGTCGTQNGGLVCGDWSTGDCCSSSGWCGSGDAYCSNGCQSGSCTTGGETSDGTCGIQGSNTFCGSWSLGTCCSSAGYCGSDDAHCGTGCQSGCPSTDGTCGAQNSYNTCPEGSCCSADGKCGTSDDFCGIGCQSGECQGGENTYVEIDPDIWTTANPSLQCYPPCTFVLPPLPLPSETTISIPPVIETVEETWPLSTQDGTTVYTTITTVLTITVPAITTNAIQFSNVEWNSTSSDDTIIWAWTSLDPSPLYFTTTLGSEPVYWTYSPGPWPPGTDSTTPAHSTTPPASFVHGSFPAHSGKPKPTCTHPGGCGHPCEHNCGPPGIKPPSIGPPGGLHWCLGLGCGGGAGGSGGSGGGGGGCIGPGCGGGGGGGGGGEEDCPEPSTVSDCRVVCTPSPTVSPRTTSCSTTCFSAVGCDITATTTTKTGTKGLPASAGEWNIDDIFEWTETATGTDDSWWAAHSSSLVSDFGSDPGGTLDPAPTNTGDPGGSLDPAPTNTGDGGSLDPAPTNTGDPGGSLDPAPTNTNDGGSLDPAPTNTGDGGGSLDPAPTNTGDGGGRLDPAPTNTGGGKV